MESSLERTVNAMNEGRHGHLVSRTEDLGYHPLLVSFANTKEALPIVNRSGNVYSAEDAAGHLDKSIDICTQAGFRNIRMRGAW